MVTINTVSMCAFCRDSDGRPDATSTQGTAGWGAILSKCACAPCCRPMLSTSPVPLQMHTPERLLLPADGARERRCWMPSLTRSRDTRSGRGGMRGCRARQAPKRKRKRRISRPRPCHACSGFVPLWQGEHSQRQPQDRGEPQPRWEQQGAHPSGHYQGSG